MTDPSAARLGPTLCGVVVCPDLDAAIAAYRDFLALRVVEQGALGEATATLWRAPQLAAARSALLSSESGTPWLRLVEDAAAGTAPPFRRRGWMALEILVQDPDALAASLRDSPFEILGEPAGLDVNPEIRATQVKGPAGEVLYLTRTGEDAIFDLPLARCAVDQLFVGVLNTAERGRSLAAWEQMTGAQGMSFDTRLGAVNSVRGYAPEREHPLAVLQLAGKSLVEIDQLPEADVDAVPAGRLPPGIALLSFATPSLEGMPTVGEPCILPGAFYEGRRAALCRGADGELIELVEQPPP